MKKIIALFIAILFIPVLVPSEGRAAEGGNNTTFLLFATVKTEGHGYGYPFGTQFYIFSHGGWVVWYYDNGTTTIRYILQPTEIKGGQLGIAYVMFGIWKSPHMFSQPGNITANMLILFGVIVEMK